MSSLSPSPKCTYGRLYVLVALELYGMRSGKCCHLGPSFLDLL